MANIIENPVQLEGDELGIFLKPVTENPEIINLGWDVRTDIKNTKWIYTNTELDKITKARTGCGWVLTGGNSTITRKAVTMVDLQVQLEQCADEFKESIFAKARKAGVDVNDLTGTEIETYIKTIVNDAVRRDALRIALLGDTSDPDDDYSMMDGLYVMMKAAVADGTVDAGAISDTDINTTNILATLNAIRNAASPKFKQLPRDKKVWYVTDTVADAWENYLITIANLESSKKEQRDGIGELTFKGEKMVRLSLVDQYLLADFPTGSPATGTNPNRIIYTTPENIILLLDTSNYAEAKFWYLDKEDMNYLRVRYSMMITIIHPELAVIAGF